MTTYDFTLTGKGDDRNAAWQDVISHVPMTPPPPAPLMPNWFYPLHATCRVCHETLQFDIDPNGTPGRNGDWGANGDYGCITGDDEGTDGHTPINIRWEPVEYMTHNDEPVPATHWYAQGGGAADGHNDDEPIETWCAVANEDPNLWFERGDWKPEWVRSINDVPTTGTLRFN